MLWRHKIDNYFQEKMGQTNSTSHNIGYNGVHHHSKSGDISFMNGTHNAGHGRKHVSKTKLDKTEKDKKVKKDKSKESRKSSDKSTAKLEECRNVARYGYEDRNKSFLSKLKINETKPLISSKDAQGLGTDLRDRGINDGLPVKNKHSAENVGVKSGEMKHVDNHGNSNELQNDLSIPDKPDTGDANHNVNVRQLENFNREFEKFVSKVRQEASSSHRSEVPDVKKVCVHLLSLKIFFSLIILNY